MKLDLKTEASPDSTDEEAGGLTLFSSLLSESSLSRTRVGGFGGSAGICCGCELGVVIGLLLLLLFVGEEEFDFDCLIA